VDLRRGVGQRVSARLAVVERAADALIRHGSPSEERIHRFHSELRRLRVESRVWRSGLSPAQVELLTGLDRRLAELARRVGEVRDADVHLNLLGKVGRPDEPDRTRRHREELYRRLQDDARIGRELLRAYLRAEIEAGVFAELRGTLAREGSNERRPLSTGRVRDEVARVSERLERATRRAARRPSVKRAHRLRILLRRARYLLEFLATVPGADPPRYPGRLVRLQRTLGRVHDLDLLEDWVDGLAPELKGSPWARELRATHRASRRQLRSELGRGSIRSAVRALGV
jgi:CHAD domain-containing protein